MKPLPSALAAAAVAAALFPAGALAAVGHWASPVEVFPSAGDTAPLPQVMVDGGGRSLVLAADASRPSLAAGTAAGSFGAPTPLGPDLGPTPSSDAALTPDGGVVVAYASGGGAHVVLAGPGGAVGPAVDLGGTGVNSIAVAIAPDTGAVVVAYRTKEADGSYGLLLRSAARGSTAFGDATTLDAGPPFDNVDVAAGNNGAVAVVYRRLSPRYRTWAVVRAGGAKNFEGTQLLGVGAEQADVDPRVVIDGGGMIVAAWANPEGAQYATRGIGDNAWAGAQSLGEGAYSMDLAVTPSGATAAAWAGSGVVRSAVRGRGAGALFGPPTQVDAFDGPIGVDPAVTVAPDGTVTVLTVRPTEGEIRAVDVGGGNELIGYGGAETATPVAVASSADRTVAVWRNFGGGYSVATRSASAPPSQGPGPKPPRPDKTAPKLAFAGATKRLSFRRTPTRLTFLVRCDEACRVSADGSLRITVGKRRLVAPLHPFSGKDAAAGVQKVVLKLGPSTRRDLRRSLARRRGAIALINLTATDASNNQSRGGVRLSLKPKPATKTARRVELRRR